MVERSRWRCTSSSDYESSFRYLICSDYPAVWCLLNRMWNYLQTTPSGVGVPPWARCRVAGTWGDLRVWEEETQAPRGRGGVGRSRTRSAWAERPALFPAGPLSGPVSGWSDVRRGTLLPWPHSTAQAVGRKGVLACTVPGQAPVPGPERWKGGELRSHPRLPNPESEAFIRSVLTWIMSWPRKEEEIDEERAEAPELAAQSQLCQHLPAVGLPRPWPITTACQLLPSRGPSKLVACLTTAEAPELSRCFSMSASTSV